MKIFYSLLFVITLSQFLLSQNSNFVEYKILMIGSPQEIHLIKDENDTYRGYINAEFYKPHQKFLGILIRKHKEIVIKIDLNPSIVENTMKKLQNAGIETIEDCRNDADCKSINFLDPDVLVFKINNSKNTKKLEFEEVYPENTKKDNVEQNVLRRKAQILVTIIDENLKLKEKFKIVRKQLNKPYCYGCGGISSCCVY
ncbi:hypothetical protein [Bergeyella sp. RCAD1439]|uniref:hypothetical protein n=1 Tax=Bergeyella anatis TaxID=3113737 RepID=UPI002E179BC5|nr:hypothetical protein [Bergeyella sp. RCAD1439]